VVVMGVGGGSGDSSAVTVNMTVKVVVGRW